jgi:NAD(P)-dependent dehydrogenase (short-subunit alcohol dehydrogenase family)
VKELSDRVAVVTGAGGGIGAALAEALAEEGMHVVVADLDGDAVERVADEVRGRGRRALAVATDVSKREALDELARRTWDEFGACHLLCNNAGVLVLGPLEERSDLDWQWVIGVNLLGVVHGIQAFVPRMLRQEGEGHIVNTASISGLVAFPLVGVYSTTKYAVVGLSESLRADLAKHGIGVSVLCPGGVQTRILQSSRNRPAELGGAPRAVGTARAVAGSLGVGEDELIDPPEVARAVIAGVLANDPFIMTHPRYRALLEERHLVLMEACDRAEERGFR